MLMKVFKLTSETIDGDVLNAIASVCFKYRIYGEIITKLNSRK